MTSTKLRISLIVITAFAYQPATAGKSETRSAPSISVRKAAFPGRTASAGSGGSSKSTIRDCYLKVDGIVSIDNRCRVYPMGDGGYTLNSWDGGKPRRSHFAVVSVGPDGKGDATWNADPDDDRALDPLGRMTMLHGCWQNARAVICARLARHGK